MNARLLLILLLLTVGMRIVQLSADPPSDFDWSGGYFADEGYWSHNARNLKLFDSAKLDEWDARVVTPVFAWCQNVIFELAGAGLIQVRIVGVFSALLLALSTFYIAKKNFDSATAFAVATLVSLNFPMLVLARQGIPDPFAAALAWTALCLLLLNSAVAAFAAGLLLVAALITKYFMIYTLLPIACMLIWKRFRPVSVGAFAAGIIFAASIWIFWNVIPNDETLTNYNRFYSSQQSQQVWSIGPVVKNIILQPFFLYAVKSPGILLFGNLMLWYTAIRFRESKQFERIVWLWVLTGILFFALWRYRPLRYYTSLFPPLAVLAALAIINKDSIAQALRESRFRLLLWIGIALPVLQITFVLVDRWLIWNQVPPQLGIHTSDALLFLVLSFITFFCFLKNKTKWIPLILVSGMILSDGRNYLQWMIQPEYNAVEISRDLQERIPDAIISGQWAPELVLENDLRAVPVWKDFVNSNRPFQRFGITHLLLWRYPLGDELEKFSEWYPDDLNQFRQLHLYRIKNSDLLLMEKIKHDTIKD